MTRGSGLGTRDSGSTRAASSPESRASSPRRFLVVQTSFLGDTILTTPLLAHLARHGEVDVVTTPASAPLLAHHPAVREVIVYDKRGADRGIRGLLRLAARLRERAYDAALMAQGSVRSGALALLARVPARIGFHSSAGRRFYTHRVAFVEGEHHVARLLALASPLVGLAQPDAASARPRLYPGDAERAAVDALLAHAGWAGEPLVALAPGSVWATKRWPAYAELAPLLHDARIVVVGAKGDAALAAAIAESMPEGRVIDATGALPLLASAELIGRCRALVTNDSSPLHLASAMGTPTVAIFGPTVPEFGFGPLAPRARVAGVTSLACRPCDRHGPQRCPLGHWRCMREITPEQVAALVREVVPT